MGRNSHRKPASQSIRIPTPPHTRIPASRVAVTAQAVENPIQGVPLWGGRAMGRAIIGRRGAGGREGLPPAPAGGSRGTAALVKTFTSRLYKASQSGDNLWRPSWEARSPAAG